MSVQEPALQDSYWMSTHLSLLLSCADDFRSYCLPRCHILSCQFLTNTINSQLMGSLGGRTGPGGPHLCSLGGTTEWVCICCSEASLEMVYLVTRLGCFERFLMTRWVSCSVLIHVFSTQIVKMLPISTWAFRLLW